MDDFSVTFGIYGIIVSYVLLGVAILGFIGFELFHLATNITQSKGQLIGAGALALIMGLAYALGSSDFSFPGIETFEMTPNGLRLVDMGVITTYVLLGIATIGLVVDLLSGLVKR